MVNPKDQQTLTLLSKINGTVKPGEMCALMGASGAGKSTLLDVLAARKNTGEITGSILFDGAERNPEISRNIAYVMQDDIHLPMLSVRETLLFAAHLRMDMSNSLDEKNQRVEKMIDILSLQDVANTVVGNHLIRGIPGGKKRRLSIGVEIINFPGLIFLDGKFFLSSSF